MVLPISTITQSARQTQEVGRSVGHSLLEKGSGVRVICLWGELGSGKTTFVQGLARGLRITSRLLSPTFIIVRRYQIPKKSGFLYHLDLYRVNTVSDAASVGFADMIRDPESIVVIEWPERLEGLLPTHRLDIQFTVLPNGDHRIESNNL